MTTFAERIEALPKMPKTLADVPDGSFGGFLVTERDALEARLRLAVELLGDVVDAKASEAIFWGKAGLGVQAYQDLRTRFGLRDDARALVERVKEELK